MQSFPRALTVEYVIEYFSFERRYLGKWDFLSVEEELVDHFLEKMMSAAESAGVVFDAFFCKFHGLPS